MEGGWWRGAGLCAYMTLYGGRGSTADELVGESTPTPILMF